MGETIEVKKVGRFGIFPNPIPKKLEAALFNRLAYKREGWEFMKNPMLAWERFYWKRKAGLQRCFPWGLINEVEIILENWQKQYGDDYKIFYDKNISYTLDKFPSFLRPYQIEAIKSLTDNFGGIISAPCGSGKTLITIEFLKRVRWKKCLIVVTTIDLKTQWNQILAKNVKGFGKMGPANRMCQMYVMTYQSINYANQDYLKTFDMVIFDECHHVSAKTLFKIAMQCSEAIMVGLSATPFRAYFPETLKITAALGRIVYSITTRELIDQGYLCDAQVNIVEELYDTPEITVMDDYQSVYEKCIVDNEVRNNYVVGLASDCIEDGLVLILVDRLDHGKVLLDSLKNDTTIPKDKIVFVHGSSKDRKQIFEDVKIGTYKIVIASKIYTEGIDIPRLKTLILAGGGKSSVALIQKIGRLLRLFPNKEKAIIYDFQDNAKYLNKHFKQRLKIYKDLFEVKWI